MTASKYRIAVRLTIPLAKSSKWKKTPSASAGRSSAGSTAPTASPAVTSAAQNSAPAMNATVALPVRNDASIPTAISAAPANQ